MHVGRARFLFSCAIDRVERLGRREPHVVLVGGEPGDGARADGKDARECFSVARNVETFVRGNEHVAVHREELVHHAKRRGHGLHRLREIERHPRHAAVEQAQPERTAKDGRRLREASRSAGDDLPRAEPQSGSARADECSARGLEPPAP